MSKKRLSGVNSQAFFNIMSTVILSGINFFTIPIFTRMLGAASYGVYSLFHSWVIIFTCIMGMETQASGGTARYVFRDNYKEYLSSSLFLGTLSCTAFLVLSILLREPLGRVLDFSPFVVVMLFLCAFGNYVVGFAKSMFVYQKKAQANFLLSVSLSVATIGLSIFLLRYFPEERHLARILGASLPYIAVAAVLWIWIFFRKPVAYNRHYWTYCLTMGLPLVLHVLANDVLKQSDKVMLNYLGCGAEAVGIYSFICTYTGIVQTLLSALNTSWCPFYYDDLNEQAFDRLKGKCRNYLELFTVLACGFLLVSREVCYVFASREYWSGMGVIPILVLGIYFVFMYQFPVNFEFYNKKTRIIAMGTIGAAVGNILMNLLLIPQFGMYGAAVATAAAYGLLFLAHYYIAGHLKEMKFHMRLWQFLPGLGCVLVCMVLFYALQKLWLVRWTMGACLGIFELLRIVKRKRIF